MNIIFNHKILNIIPLIFFIIIIVKILYLYQNLKENEYNFAKKEAEVLNSNFLINRNYYQKLYIDEVIKLDKNSVVGFPAYSDSIISKRFSNNNPLNIIIRTVSNEPRNPLNTADIDESKAIEFFEKNEKEENYFTKDSDKYYQYASVLRITNVCLECHGQRKDAPAFIRENYETAYDYHLGEIRGIVSIKIPKQKVTEYFLKNFIETIIYDLFLLLLLYFGISYLIQKTKNINKLLKIEINEKTDALKSTYVIDKLTKLPNRRKLIEDIELYKDKKNKHLALLNIDAFKDVNDFYGYEAGDKILKEFSNIFLQECGEKAFVYKLPSDEFAIFSVDTITKEEFIDKVSNLVIKIHKKEFEYKNNKIFMIMSCGISSNENQLLQTADIALNHAKLKNINLVIYNKTLNISKQIIQNSENLTLLNNALENNLIVPFFQPIYNVKYNKIEKYECLIRIVLENGDIIPPYKFLDVAMKSKQYLHLTKIMISKSFEYFKDKEEYEFSINLSIVDITSDIMIDFIIDKLKNFNDPSRVVFEILEDNEVQNYEEIKEFIKTIKQFGCKFAIDDFGSGYSNFSHIYELNIDYIKIDASLVKYISENENSKVITQTIINFAKNLNLKTIAEYVEDEKSMNILKDMGIDYIQGYYIGKPEKNIQ